MSDRLRIVIASRNPAKIKEIRQIFASMDVDLVPPDELSNPLPEVEETGDTYLANALLKAKAICEATGHPAMADDSGIEVDVLDGAPGVRSARYAGEGASDEDNNAKLIASLGGKGADERTARYRCVAVLVMPDGREFASMGSCEGAIATEARGSGGFGYDPWFIPDGYEVTMAELDPQEKDAISHRGKAFRGLADQVWRRLKPQSLPRQ